MDRNGKVWMNNILLHIVHPFTHILSCFHILANVNNSAKKWECRYVFEKLIYFSLAIYPEVVFLDHTVVPFVMFITFIMFLETSALFSIMTAPFYILTRRVQGSPFSTSSLRHCHFFLFSFCNSHSNRCDVISHCGFS